MRQLAKPEVGQAQHSLLVL